MSREAMKMAMEALEQINELSKGENAIALPGEIDGAMESLRAALDEPEREWVGLTDEEVRDFWSWSMTAEAERTANTQQHAFARAIEAKLKEKNNG